MPDVTVTGVKADKKYPLAFNGEKKSENRHLHHKKENESTELKF